MSYAANTKVPPERTKAQIEALLVKHGASEFMHKSSTTQAAIGFVMSGFQIEIRITLPQSSAFSTEREYKQRVRSLWRGILLYVTSKMNQIEEGFTTIEHEFLSDIVIDVDPRTGRTTTVGDRLLPVAREISESGTIPPLLPERT